MTESSSPSAAGGMRPWWQPTFSHQHGPLVALLVSFLLGAAGAHRWTVDTTLALVVVLAAFQAEHPLVQQIRRRRSLQPRLLLWLGLYGAIAVGLGALLAWRSPTLIPLGILAVLVLALDALAVLQRRQRGLTHELIAFGAVALAGPFAWTVGSGSLEPEAAGLWGLCSLYFGSSVVLLKVRRDAAAGIAPALMAGALATALVSAGWWLGLLQPFEALAYGVALLKGAWLLSRLEPYRSASIGRVAAIESATALLFLVVAALGVLPATLEPLG
ncbi:MAG: hypothetical protein ER33_07405 [Cyanobium sp. CACIAM 14]|nr:MAG: hypothetical protein ER33_07405 [Cyanobium sp. CACIAM 14]